MTDEEKLIEELHEALDRMTSMFCSTYGFNYHCVTDALSVLQKSGDKHRLPITKALAEKIEEYKKA